MVWNLRDPNFGRIKILRSEENGQLLHLRHVLALDAHPAMALLGKNAIPVVVSVGGVRSPYDRSTTTQNPDPNIVIWDLDAGSPLKVFSTTVANPTLKPFTALRIWADGSKIVTSAGLCASFQFYRVVCLDLVLIRAAVGKIFDCGHRVLLTISTI
jgi:hypothetical protein